MSEPTPRPWVVGDNGSSMSRIFAKPIDGTGRTVDICGVSTPVQPGGKWDEARANAELICRAVNAHDDLVAALQAMLASAHPHPVEHPTMTAAWAQAREVLARAEGLKS
jgi:hypothetical protein